MSIHPLKTIGEIALERLDICSKEIGQRFFTAVRPCFVLDGINQPVAMGSCFFLQLDGLRYLLTAAHVLDEAEHRNVYVSAGRGLALLTGLFGVTKKPGGDRNKDYYDFAFVELSDAQCDDLGATFFITESMISHNRSDKERRGYMALGFPAQMQLANYEIRRMFTEAWTYVGFHRPSQALNESLGISGEQHFAIHFEERVKTFKGTERDAPDPQGASGGVLIDLGSFDPDKLRSNAVCTGLLSGILIEHRREHEIMLATDIRFVMEQIRRTGGMGRGRDA